MREINFRAWNNKFKEFKFMSLINYLGIRGIMDDWADSEHSVWEQYTGIKDKNSVDVYEGDYIKAKSTIYKIEWFNTAFWAIPESGYGSSQPISSLYEYEDGMAYKVEVIGNIHESPELLEEQ